MRGTLCGQAAISGSVLWMCVYFGMSSCVLVCVLVCVHVFLRVCVCVCMCMCICVCGGCVGVSVCGEKETLDIHAFPVKTFPWLFASVVCVREREEIKRSVCLCLCMFCTSMFEFTWVLRYV